MTTQLQLTIEQVRQDQASALKMRRALDKMEHRFPLKYTGNSVHTVLPDDYFRAPVSANYGPRWYVEERAKADRAASVREQQLAQREAARVRAEAAAPQDGSGNKTRVDQFYDYYGEGVSMIASAFRQKMWLGKQCDDLHWELEQMAKRIADQEARLRELIAQDGEPTPFDSYGLRKRGGAGGEVDDYKIQRADEFLRQLLDDEDEAADQFHAAKLVHRAYLGEEWRPRPKPAERNGLVDPAVRRRTAARTNASHTLKRLSARQ